MNFIGSTAVAICLLTLFGLGVCKPTPASTPWYFLKYPEEGDQFEGDILEDPNQMTRAGINSAKARWPNATLVYNIGLGFTGRERSLIQTAMDQISSATCLKFRQGSSGDYVEFVKGNSGCSSNVGRVGGRQPINLASGCFNVGSGTVMHEIIHAFGFYHEQSRSDRDKFVTIRYLLIYFFTWTNFQRQSNSVNFDVPYDYASIMHYPRDAFGYVPGVTTIDPEDSSALKVMGQRKQLSQFDILKLNRMYCSQ